MIRRRSLLLAAPAVIAARSVSTAATVKVGVLLPLTGNSAASGGEGRAAVEAAAGVGAYSIQCECADISAQVL